MEVIRMKSNLIMLFIAILTLAILSSWLLADEPGKYDKGTVFSFHFNEGKGKDVSDSSGNENHGILGGGKTPEWVDGPEGKFGSALEFKDANYVEIPESAKLDTDEEITFEAWLRLKALKASWATLYSKHDQSNGQGFHWIYIYSDSGKLAYQYCDGTKYITQSADVKWEFGKWTHVAITHKINGTKGGVIKWYINGELINELEHKEKALVVIGGKASIGTYQSNPALDRYALDGAMDEVRLSPRVKTDREIMESMRGLAVKPYGKLANTWGRIKY
jgi:hypothetical protein